MCRDTILVYSEPDKINRYSLDGDFISSSSIPDLGVQSFFDGENYMTYHGYSGSGPFRFMGYRGKTTGYKALESKGKVMPISTNEPVFTQGREGVVMQDSYSNVLYRVSATSCEPYKVFDFGEYAIDESFFRATDAFEGIEMLMNTSFARISRYEENGQCSVLSVILQFTDRVIFVYGLEDNGEWKWYSMGSPGENPFSGSFRILNDHCMIFLVSAGMYDKFNELQRGKIVNHYSVHDIQESDYAIVEVYLKW